MINKNITILIIIGVVLYFIVSRFYPTATHYEFYKIEVGATAKNFSGYYLPLFNTMDKNHNGVLSHSEILYFYNNADVTKDDSFGFFKDEHGKWIVNEGLRDAALEYYTHGRIVTPELDDKYGRAFIGINSGIDNVK